MKHLVLTLGLLIGSTAFADGATCVNSFGTEAKLSMSGKNLKVSFNSPTYSKASLTYKADTGGSFVFESWKLGGPKAYVEKQVFNGQSGKMVYHKRTGKNAGGHRSTFRCN